MKGSMSFRDFRESVALFEDTEDRSSLARSISVWSFVARPINDVAHLARNRALIFFERNRAIGLGSRCAQAHSSGKASQFNRSCTQVHSQS
jgi:hypothetical protein